MGVIVSTSSAKTSAPKAGSKGTLNIGIITSVGGTIIDYPFTVSAVIAGVRAINKAGGVHGYKLGVVYCNTQGDPNQEVACARQAVDKHVIATVGGFIFTNPQGYYQTLSDANIADVGQLRASTQAFTFKNSFPIVFGDGAYVACLTPSVLKAVGSNSSAVVAADTPATVPIINLVTQVAATNNLPAPKVIKIPVTASDMTPYAQQAVGLGTAIGAFPAPSTVAYITAGHAVGANYAYCTTQGIVSWAPWIQLGNNAGKIFQGLNNSPITDASKLPMLQQFVNQMKVQEARGDSNATTDPSNFNSQALNAWLAVQVVKQVVAGMKVPVNSSTFLAAIAKAKVKMGGIIPNIDFTRCIAAGPYQRVFNWTARVGQWDAQAKTMQVIPHSTFDALRYAFGASAEHSGNC
jgi:ABC-type branched-subunit amino acid transport system substrate-binding protein